MYYYSAESSYLPSQVRRAPSSGSPEHVAGSPDSHGNALLPFCTTCVRIVLYVHTVSSALQQCSIYSQGQVLLHIPFRVPLICTSVQYCTVHRGILVGTLRTAHATMHSVPYYVQYSTDCPVVPPFSTTLCLSLVQGAASTL